MPEGNTIHWLARVHTRDFAGRRVRAASPQGRFAREARRLDGRRFEAAEAYGKHLFHRWSGGLVVHVHLGMAGWFYRYAAPAPPPRPTVRLRLATREVTTDLIGPPTCELIPEFARRKLLARLGPDPLRRDFDPDRALAALAKRPRRTIGDALLDQRVLAGVGNIYRAEALFLTGIHPKRPSASLSAEEWERLWKTVRALMRRGAVRGTHPDDRAPGTAGASARRPRSGRRLLRLPAGDLPPLRVADRGVPDVGAADVRLSPLPARATPDLDAGHREEKRPRSEAPRRRSLTPFSFGSGETPETTKTARSASPRRGHTPGSSQRACHATFPPDGRTLRRAGRQRGSTLLRSGVSDGADSRVAEEPVSPAATALPMRRWEREAKRMRPRSMEGRIRCARSHALRRIR